MADGSVRLAEAHRLAQQRLGVELIGWLRRTFPLLDLFRIDETTARWLEMTLRLVLVQHSRSARLAGDYLSAARELDVGADPEWVPALAEANGAQIATSLRVTGPIRAKELSAGGRALGDVSDAVFVSTSRSAMRSALAGGRDTIIGSVHRDRHAHGWARTASGNPCAFCAMLVSRGPVYSARGVRFRAHDGCSCGAMPVYNRHDGWTDQARMFRDTWNDTAKGDRDPLNAFRRALAAH